MGSAAIGGEVKAALGLAALLTILGTLVDDGTFGLLLVPVVYLILVFAMIRVPLRYSALGLMALALTLQDANDGCAERDFQPPFHSAGAILFSHLNTLGKQMGFGWASFSGMDLLLVALFLVSLVRGTEPTRFGWVASPRPLIRLAYLSLLSTAFVWALGMVRGGDFGKSLWQLNRVMYLPLVFLLFQKSLRGPKDLGAFLKVILFAGVYKSLLALYVVSTLVLKPDPMTGSTRPAWATSHQDSILFAVAFVSVLAVLLERAVPRAQLKWYASLLPILAAGIWANNRRMAWVQVALVFVMVYILSNPRNPVKRKITRTLYALSPVALVYLAVGWNAGSSIFKPVRMFRSIVDPQTDSSSLWRELENFDIIMTFRQNPLFGSGYGIPYDDVIPLPAVDYDLERYAPHNSLLGLWAYCGMVGYATLTLLWVVGVYFSLRTYRGSKDPRLRAASLVCFGTVLIYLIQCWGDLGLGTWIGIFTVSPGLALAGKLAVASGEWASPAPARNPFTVGQVGS